jgi:predicted HTH domain antitoxin
MIENLFFIMTLIIPDNLLPDMSPQQVLEELAVSLYRQEQITLAQGAEMLTISVIAFQKTLAQRNINLHYDVEDLAIDLQNWAK